MSWSWLVSVAESNAAALGDLAIDAALALHESVPPLLDEISLLYEIVIVFAFWIAVPLAIGACAFDCCRGVAKVREA